LTVAPDGAYDEAACARVPVAPCQVAAVPDQHHVEVPACPLVETVEIRADFRRLIHHDPLSKVDGPAQGPSYSLHGAVAQSFYGAKAHLAEEQLGVHYEPVLQHGYVQVLEALLHKAQLVSRVVGKAEVQRHRVIVLDPVAAFHRLADEAMTPEGGIGHQVHALRSYDRLLTDLDPSGKRCRVRDDLTVALGHANQVEPQRVAEELPPPVVQVGNGGGH